jgi:hypothetical protein
LSKLFLLALALLLLSLTLIVSITVFEPKKPTIENFAQLTTLPGFALSVTYLEPKNRFYADNHESLFVKMKPINTMDFVYAK